jgi:hypothetical protein
VLLDDAAIGGAAVAAAVVGDVQAVGRGHLSLLFVLHPWNIDPSLARNSPLLSRAASGQREGVVRKLLLGRIVRARVVGLEPPSVRSALDVCLQVA